MGGDSCTVAAAGFSVDGDDVGLARDCGRGVEAFEGFDVFEVLEVTWFAESNDGCGRLSEFLFALWVRDRVGASNWALLASSAKSSPPLDNGVEYCDADEKVDEVESGDGFSLGRAVGVDTCEGIACSLSLSRLDG